MEIAIRPEDLQAAAAALWAASARLDDATLTFIRRAQIDAPGLGVKAEHASARGIRATEDATQVLATDISRLAHALAGLAQHYPRVDATAVPLR